VAMAADLGAVHAATGKVERIATDLESRGSTWLADAAAIARKAVKRDFDRYRS